MQSSCRVFWVAAHGSRPSCTSISRNVHSATRRHPLITPFNQPASFTIPSALAARDFHVQKKRRYSSHQPADARTDENANDELHQPARNDDGDIQPAEPTKRKYRLRKMGKAETANLPNNPSRDDGLDEAGPLRGSSKSPNSAKAAGGKGKKKRLELRDLAVPKKKEPWQLQKQALKEKFGEDGWNPRKKLSPDTMEGIRALHEQDPDRWSTPVLADHFKVSPESIRRILKSKWRPSEKEMEKRRERWAKRHDRIWDKLAELGLRPQRTKEKPLEGPDEFEESLKAKEILDNARNA